MASGLQPAQVVGPGSVPTNKGQHGNSSSVGCLPFPSHSRQHSDNFPDVVDNDTYLQLPYSESSNDVSDNSAALPMPSSSGAPNNGRDRVSSDSVPGYRVAGTYVPRVSDSEPTLPMSDNAPYSNEQSDVILGRPAPVQLPTYRQINTRDINVGVSTRLDHRTDAIPDLLHSHVPQPSRPAAMPPQNRTPVTRNERRTRNNEVRNQAHHRTRETPSRSRHGHRNRTRSTSSAQMDDPVCKAPCVQCFVKVTSFRWVLVVLSLLGVCCVVTGIVLAALHAAGNSFLFLAIMFIGLGVLLVIVVGVGWKCTPRGHEPLHALFGIGDFQQRRDRRPHRAHRSRDNNWYGGVLYPEFQYRRPPPTYAASMQEYQQQLYIAQQQQEQYVQTGAANPATNESYSLPSSPPPSYRSRASTIHSGIHITFPPNQEDLPDSRPPTYRSRRGSAHPRPPIPREEFESMDREDNVPADISFAGPVNSAQRDSAEAQRDSAEALRNTSSESERPTRDVTGSQSQTSDSTVTINGMVIEPSSSTSNNSLRDQSENIAAAASANASSVSASSVSAAGVGTSAEVTSSSTAAQSTTTQAVEKQSVLGQSSLNNNNEEPQRVETSL